MRFLMALAFSLALAGAATAAEIKGTLRIDAVTVYPAGAEIVRTGRIKLEPGDHTLLFADLPAEAVPGSIRVEGKATAGLQIGSVDTRQVSVPSTDDKVVASERRRLEEAIQKFKDDKAVLEARIQAAETQKRLIDNLTKLPTTPPPGGATAPAAQPDWGELFELVGARATEAQRAILTARAEIRKIERTIEDLEGKLASLAPTGKRRTEVKVALTADAALEAEMVVRYQVRSAWWTPHYDARLTVGENAEAPKLQLVRRAAIRQRTGEVWDNVALALSTARPTAGTSAPELTPVTIDFEPEKPITVSRAPQQAPLAPPPRSARLRAARGVAGETDAADREMAGFAATQKRAEVQVQAFQAVYSIGGRTTVPDTGETKQVEIDEIALVPTLVVRAVPKRTEKAYLYAKITTAKGAPLLPGRVALFRDSVFVGNGELPLLAPAEEHELGFGIDDSVRVRHDVSEEKRSETGIIATAKTDARSWRISVKNLHGRTVAVSVIDQIPVSQNDDITVELTGKSAPTRRNVDNKRGVLAWDMKLEPNEERVIEFGYRARWPAAKKVRYGHEG